MHVKMNIINKCNRNENSMSDFLSTTFSPVMANLAAATVLGKVHHWHWAITVLGK